MKGRITFVFIFAIIASILPDIIIGQYFGQQTGWLNLAKMLILLTASIIFFIIKEFRELSKFTTLLATVIAVQILTSFISASSIWKNTFNTSTFIGNIGSNILLKFLSIVPIIILLFIMIKKRESFYLCKGDLSVRADKISWLGIKGGIISWKRLSIISAILISTGTVLLTIITAPNLSFFKGIVKLMNYFPIIILFALANSFCEGVIYRSGVMGTLREALSKRYVVLIAAVFFGIPHYYGIPSGILGALMSSVLGWYMCRSMYETRGFASSWIIHFMQDAVVFSTVCLLGNLI